MTLRRVLCGLIFVGAVVVCVVAPSFGVVSARIAGTVTYTGTLGPVSARRPLCVCFYLDANLRDGLGCIILSSNPAPYSVVFSNPQTAYMVAFVDLNENEGLSPGEPYEIYKDRSAPPADAVVAAPMLMGVDFTFGDENLPNASPSSTPTAPPTSTPTSTPSPPTCVGDCDGSGDIVINELITMVSVALGNADVAACTAGDRNGDGSIDITEITAAVSNAAAGCPAA